MVPNQCVASRRSSAGRLNDDTSAKIAVAVQAGSVGSARRVFAGGRQLLDNAKMTNDSLPVDTLTRQLVTAWRTGQLLDESAVAPPDYADQAYQVQLRVAREMHWPLDTPVRAWKVGAANRTAQPNAAFLWSHGLHNSPAQVDAGTLPLLGIEGEIAVRIANVTPTGNGLPKVEIDACCVSIELVSSRFAQSEALHPLLKLADQGLHQGLVLGQWNSHWPDDWSAVSCRLTIDGQPMTQATGTHPCTDPTFSLSWLARHAAAMQMPLRAGDIVTTGSWIGLVKLAPGSLAEVEFADIGKAVLQLR